MSEEEKRTKVVFLTILFYFGIFVLFALLYPIVVTIFSLAVIGYYDPTGLLIVALDPELYFGWIFVFIFMWRFFAPIFLVEVIVVILAIWNAIRRIRIKEGKEPLRDRVITRHIARFYKLFRSIKVFPTQKHLQEIGESNANEITTPMTFREILNSSAVINFTIAYAVTKIILFFIPAIGESEEVILEHTFEWLFIMGVLPVILFILYWITLSNLPVYWHKKLGTKVLNDVFPMEKIFRYGSVIAVVLLFSELVAIFGLENDFLILWHSTILFMLIAHIFISFFLANILRYSKGQFRTALKYAAKGLLDLSGSKNVYFGAQEYFNRFIEEHDYYYSKATE